MDSQTWRDSAKTALTDLGVLGTNILTGVTNSAKARIDAAQPTPPVTIAPAPVANNNNMLWLLGGAAALIFVLRKK